MKLATVLCVAALTLAHVGTVQAQSFSPTPADMTAELIRRAADEIGKEIIFDSRIGISSINTTEGNSGDYESLLGVLRVAGYVAVESADQVLVLHENLGRSVSTRVVNDDDRRVSDHEFVTRVMHFPEVSITATDGSEGHLSAAQLVPILRPMMSQAAQLAAPPMTNTLVIVDRYDNVRRITRVVEDIVAGLE